MKRKTSLGKRFIVGAMALAFLGGVAVIPAVCAFGDEEAPVQPTETAQFETAMPDNTVVILASETPSVPVAEQNTVLIYDVPLDLELQLFIIQVCEDYHIDPAVVVAMIERESRFNAGAIGDNGKSFGLMQIQKRWHEDRMERLGATDLLNPYQNVAVGVDYLAEMLGYCNGDVESALVCYNMGLSGAQKHCFSKGVYSTAYSQGILERSRAFREGGIEYVLD